MLKQAVIIFSYLIIFLVLFSLWGFYNAVHPPKITSNITPAALGLKYETVSFYTRDNILIKGWYIPSSQKTTKAIILLHGYPADKGDILPSRIFLHNGYNLLFIDFRYLGESGGSYSSLGKYESLDLLAAVDFLHSRGMLKIGVWGLSMGGAVALMSAAESTGKIHAVVAESSYAHLNWLSREYYRLPGLDYFLGKLTQLWAWLFLGIDTSAISPANVADKINVPVLILHSKNDQVIPYRHALSLQEAFHSHAHTQVIISEGLVHGEITEHQQKLIRDFFAHYLK